MKKFLNVLNCYIGKLIMIVAFLLFPIVLHATITVTLEIEDQIAEESVSGPLCGSNGYPSYSYKITVTSSSELDNRVGTLVIQFRGSDNGVTVLNNVAALTVTELGDGEWEGTGWVDMYNAPANRDDGEVFADFNGNVSSSFDVLLPFITISPSSASLNTETGPTSVVLTASVTSSSTLAWSPSTGLNTTSGTTVTASPGTTKVYTVTATPTTTFPTTCTATKTVTVTVIGPCCSSTRTFSNQTIVTDNVSNYITASGSSSMVNTSTVSLKAGNYILLSPDVSLIPSTGSFIAQATACTYNACKTGTFNNDLGESILLNPNFNDMGSDKIRVYPNPSTGIFTVASENRIDNITVSNGLGEVISESKSLQVDLSSKPEGVYFIGVSSNGKTVVKKVFKTK